VRDRSALSSTSSAGESRKLGSPACALVSALLKLHCIGNLLMGGGRYRNGNGCCVGQRALEKSRGRGALEASQPYAFRMYTRESSHVDQQTTCVVIQPIASLAAPRFQGSHTGSSHALDSNSAISPDSLRSSGHGACICFVSNRITRQSSAEIHVCMYSFHIACPGVRPGQTRFVERVGGRSADTQCTTRILPSRRSTPTRGLPRSQ